MPNRKSSEQQQRSTGTALHNTDPFLDAFDREEGPAQPHQNKKASQGTSRKSPEEATTIASAHQMNNKTKTSTELSSSQHSDDDDVAHDVLYDVSGSSEDSSSSSSGTTTDKKEEEKEKENPSKKGGQNKIEGPTMVARDATVVADPQDNGHKRSPEDEENEETQSARPLPVNHSNKKKKRKTAEVPEVAKQQLGALLAAQDKPQDYVQQMFDLCRQSVVS